MTPKQAEVMNYVRSTIERKGYSPSLDEIAAAIGRTKSNAKRFVDVLVDQGHLMRAPARSRGLWLPSGDAAPARVDPDVMAAARLVLDSIVHEDVTADLRAATLDLALAASRFVRGPGHAPARRELIAALAAANRALRTPVLFTTDPDALIAGYLAAGGEWRALVAAVSRNALEGATAEAP